MAETGNGNGPKVALYLYSSHPAWSAVWTSLCTYVNEALLLSHHHYYLDHLRDNIQFLMSTNLSVYISMHLWIYVRMYACMYLCRYVSDLCHTWGRCWYHDNLNSLCDRVGFLLVLRQLPCLRQLLNLYHWTTATRQLHTTAITQHYNQTTRPSTHWVEVSVVLPSSK